MANLKQTECPKCGEMTFNLKTHICKEQELLTEITDLLSKRYGEQEEYSEYNEEVAEEILTKCNKRLDRPDVCPECRGQGKTELLGRCWDCNGTGKVPKHRLDRPTVCRDCQTFERGCEGSNQEDCKRLDRPDREKIKGELLKWHDYLEANGCSLLSLTFVAKKITALFPDVEEAKKQERERVKEKLESWMMGTGIGSEADVKYNWQVEWDKFWQALKE